MTQSGGQGTYPVYPGFNFGNIGQDIQNLYKPTGTVGTEQPEWDFPQGKEAVDDDVIGAFFRGDFGPTGLNEFLQKQPPEIVDRFRAFVNGGLIRPRNAAAGNIVKGYGGLRAGDEAGPGGVLGPMQDDMPSGLSPEYWAQANNLISTMVNAKLEAAKQSGYLDGMPTMQRDQIMQQMAQGWKELFTQEFTAKEGQRAAMAQEGLSQQEINNQNIQAMAGLMGGTVDPATGEFRQTQDAKEFETEQGGWMQNGQATLSREQQAWNQAKDVAALASNPRNYMEAQMLGSARGGLGGMQPTNQIQANMTQTGPQGWNPMASMQPPGTSGAGTMAQMGPPGMDPNLMREQALGSPGAPGADQWSGWLNQAQQQQDQARQAMMGGQAGAPGAASGLSPGPGSPQMAQTYPGFQGMDGAAETPQRMIEPWQGTTPEQQAQRRATLAPQGAQGFQMPGARMGQQPAGPALGGPGAVPQRPMGMAQPGMQLGQQGPQYTTSAFTQALLKNRVVPTSGALQNQGQYMSQPQLQKEVNLNKMRGADFLRGRDSEQKGFLSATSMAGHSDEDTLGALQKSAAPAFKAPTSGRMV